MPLRRTPTLRQRRLGIELRKMRERAGFGGSQLARTLGLNPTQVTQMESGKIGVSAERLRTVAAACSCANEPLISALADMTAERSKGWWEAYRGALSTDFLDVAEMEGHAQGLATCTSTYIPGLLQTSAYASAVFSRVYPPLPAHDLDIRTTFRMRRQQVVRSDGIPYRVFIHEAALRMQFGGPRVLADQLGSLIEDSQTPGLSVRVVSFDTDTFPGSSENLTYAEGPVPELDTVQMDIPNGSQYFDSQAHLESYRAIFARMDLSALPEEESRDLMRRIKKEKEDKLG
ncbi:helix-turn-helix domain-containing protein [Kitasatospora sp. NPDC056181]|uniref:helix-turn-helix domain-containing protein n=1 Tax=Kitasatospora sp. NPDC056181 TaxID=3345737 RepID=UPI0035D60597